MKHIFWIFFGVIVIVFLCRPGEAMAGIYLDSAHGNSTYGVNRSSISSLGYARANCAHCHEQHASIEGSEPAPSDGPSAALLFYDNHVSQTDGACMKCHTDVAAVQTDGGIVNRSYSYRAGAWTADTLNDIAEAFAFTTSLTYPSSSSHNLADIRTFISAGAQSSWKYTSKANPCVACHDPHAVQGDPTHDGFTPKNDLARGWMLSLPSQHGSAPWGLWGDDVGERMSSYSSSYQALLRWGGGVFEPDGTSVEDGSNLTDFNTFCIDCHNSTNTIYSSLLSRNLIKINWGQDRHGLPSSLSATLIAPYTSGVSYVLACTDCHEPHGSPNVFLIRQEVNNGQVSATGLAPDTGGTQMASLCERCHGDGGTVMASHSAIQGGASCIICHPSGGYTDCISCHYHGSSATVNSVTYLSF
ncbi:MAG: cytochrome c3 family protein [Proteobacteria bacterium]|nr:cytochrome c3 family protein [Pseudomonadota bacterium]MBU1714260.1 cytochrome c3 family protein [Pseudomonadota bacterium]